MEIRTMPIKRRTEKAAYFETLVRRNGIAWIWGTAAALGLNLMLFAVMPHLLHPVPDKPVFQQVVSHVNVIRFRQTETPVKRQTEKPPEPPRKQKPPEATLNKPLKARLTLPFAINPRLPDGPDTLSLPSMPPESFMADGLADTFSAGDLDSPLTVLTRIPPIYPLLAKRRGVEGWVRVRFVVNEDGRVDKVTVVKSQPPGIFDQSVIRCVSGWRFKPGTVEGMPVKTRAETTIRFTLE
jgi:protein TonB